VLAIRPKTGEVACLLSIYYSQRRVDVDATDENVLADIQGTAIPRKVMIQTNKNGFLYVLDRTNCKLIARTLLSKSTGPRISTMTTGRPVLTELFKRFRDEKK